MKFLLLVLGVATLASCVTPEQRAVRRGYIEEFRAYGLPRQLMSQIENTDPLSPEDIVILSQRGVPAGLIIAHLGKAPVPYRLSLGDISRLRAQGVDDRVIDYMLTIREEAPRYETTVSYGIGGYF